MRLTLLICAYFVAKALRPEFEFPWGVYILAMWFFVQDLVDLNVARPNNNWIYVKGNNENSNI